MGINIILHSNKFVKFLIYIVFILSITNSALSKNLKEIQKREIIQKNIIEENNRKRIEELQKRCLELFEKSKYVQVLLPYNGYSKNVNSRYGVDQTNSRSRVYIDPVTSELKLINKKPNGFCYESSKVKVIPLGSLNKRITTKCVRGKNDYIKSYPYMVEVVKEVLHDKYGYRRGDSEFIIRYHKKGDCEGNWSNVEATLIGVEPYCTSGKKLNRLFKYLFDC